MEDRCDHAFTIFLVDLCDPAYVTIFGTLQHGRFMKTRDSVRSYALTRALDNLGQESYQQLTLALF
jgi:hypothetical protein